MEMETGSLSYTIYPELRTTQRLCHTSKDFQIWKRKIEFVLADHRVAYVLTEPKPPKPSEQTPTHDGDDDTDNATATATATDKDIAKTDDEGRARYEKWVRDDARAQFIILSAVAYDMYLKSSSDSTAKDLMDSLNARFDSSKYMTHRMNILRNYVNHRMSDDTPILKHIIKMDELAAELEVEGIQIPDELKAVMLVNSLPESWEDSIGALTVLMDQDLSLANVYARVRSEGEQREFLRAREEEDMKKQKGLKKTFHGSRGQVEGDATKAKMTIVARLLDEEAD